MFSFWDIRSGSIIITFEGPSSDLQEFEERVNADGLSIESYPTLIVKSEEEDNPMAAVEEMMDEIANVVSAEDLLLSVEDDLEKSFRTKAFEALKSSFETVKTAVADRNN